MNTNTTCVHAEGDAALEAYRAAVKCRIEAKKALAIARLEAATAKTALIEAILAGKISTRQFLQDAD